MTQNITYASMDARRLRNLEGHYGSPWIGLLILGLSGGLLALTQGDTADNLGADRRHRVCGHTDRRARRKTVKSHD